MITLTLPYPPSANRYWRIWNGRAVTSTEARAYKQEVAAMCLASRIQPLVGDVRVSVQVYRPAKRGDLDNTLKVALDSLKGFAFEDDKQVKEINAVLRDDKQWPRMHVEVTQIAVRLAEIYQREIPRDLYAAIQQAAKEKE